MYLPDHFAETRPDALHDLIRTHPLGLLVRHGPQGLDADHLPFELDLPATTAATAAPHPGAPLGVLRAHVARANPLWQAVADGAEVLVVFRGAQGYISPNWYPSKHEAHRQVPTWNYEAVHAHGVLTVHDNERWVRGLVARLTRRHEAGEPVPWKMGDSAPDFIDGLLRQIVGIEVAITRLEGKAKLGQNRAPRDRLGAADALAARGEQALADRMRQAGPG